MVTRFIRVLARDFLFDFLVAPLIDANTKFSGPSGRFICADKKSRLGHHPSLSRPVAGFVHFRATRKLIVLTTNDGLFVFLFAVRR